MMHATVTQLGSTELTVELRRAHRFDGFVLDLKDGDQTLVTTNLWDDYDTEGFADSLIEAGRTIKQYNEDRQYEEFDELMEEATQEEERFQREVWQADNARFTGTQEVSFA